MLHWACKSTISILPTEVVILRVEAEKRRISPFHMFCNIKAAAIWCACPGVTRTCARQHNLHSKKISTNWIDGRMARFVRQLSCAVSLTVWESLAKLRCMVWVIMPASRIPRTVVSCLYWMCFFCFALTHGLNDNAVHLWILILALFAFSYVLMISVTFLCHPCQ